MNEKTLTPEEEVWIRAYQSNRQVGETRLESLYAADSVLYYFLNKVRPELQKLKVPNKQLSNSGDE